VKQLALLAITVPVVLALLATPAAAEPFTPELEADYAAALAWWGVSSPPQCATVDREILPVSPVASNEPYAAAWATQPAPGEEGIACRLDVFADHLKTGCVEEVEIRHEVGHLTGHGHSADPESIMAPEPNIATWCPEAVAEEQAADAAKQHAEGRAASREAWREWRSEKRACRHAQDSYRRQCWRQVREIAHYLRATAGTP